VWDLDPGNETNSTVPGSRRACQALVSGDVLVATDAFVRRWGRAGRTARVARRKVRRSGDERLRSPYFAASAAIFSITIAEDPPRAYTFPLAVTLCPAKGISLSFWPAEGVVSAIGQ
jgi:hypothetical protein